MMPDARDPRDQAVRKFTTDQPIWTSLDVLMRYATDPPLAISTLLDALRPVATPGARIAEFGVGSGWLLEALAAEYPVSRLFALDLARQYVARLAPAVRAVMGDIERLPFGDAAFDSVLTCWTLYFMRDIDATLAGMRRVIRPGGIFVAATTAPGHMREFDDMAAAAIRAAGAEPEDDISVRFDTVTGAGPIARTFPRAELREWHGTLTLNDVEPMMALWPVYGPQHLDAETNARARAAFRVAAAAHIEGHGKLAISRHDGVFVATI